MAKLYELTKDYKQVLDMADDESIDLEVINNTLQAIEGAIEEKAVNIISIIKSLDGDAKIIRAEEKRLADRRKAVENRVNHIKDYLKDQMELAGIDKINTPTVTIYIQNNPPSAKVEDDKKIPSKFLTIIPEQYVPDKKRIAEAIKAGEEVGGCSLVQGRSLRIR